jgi:hypothetical protein
MSAVPASLTPAAYYVVGGLALAALSFIGGFQFAASRQDAGAIEVLDDVEGAEGFKMATNRNSKGGMVSAALRERKKRKALERGVVRWHLVGSAFEKPRYVKPEREEGGNIPELEHDGQTYYFPNDASVIAEDEGVPVVVHRKGKSDPVNLRSDWDMAVDAKSLTEYLTLRVTSRKPSTGVLDALGLGEYDAMTIFRYGVFALALLAIAYEVIG